MRERAYLSTDNLTIGKYLAAQGVAVLTILLVLNFYWMSLLINNFKILKLLVVKQWMLPVLWWVKALTLMIHYLLRRFVKLLYKYKLTLSN